MLLFLHNVAPQKQVKKWLESLPKDPKANDAKTKREKLLQVGSFLAGWDEDETTRRIPTTQDHTAYPLPSAQSHTLSRRSLFQTAGTESKFILSSVLVNLHTI